MKEYHIKSWAGFQHYKDRNPPWIKLHYELLTSRDWVKFNDASKLLAVTCMMIASRNNGIIEDDLDYIQAVAHLRTKPNLTPLINSGFLVLTEGSQADASTAQADAIIEERHIEQTETYRIEDYIAIYEEVLGLKLLSISSTRKAKLKPFATTFNLESFRQGLLQAKQSKFLSSSNFFKWDWIVNEANFTKILEGNYDNKNGTNKHTGFENQDYYKGTEGLNVI